MTKANPFISSINAGEFSPRMEARVDFDRYPTAAKMCRNLLLLPQGGITRRPGSRFIKEVKDSSDETVMLPFQFSEDESYAIEAGDEYMRFYRRQSRIEVDDTDAAVTNGAFGSNINSWAPPVTSESYIGGASDTSNATTYTFAGQSIGTANANRIVVICISGVNTAATAARYVSSVTVGGHTASNISTQTRAGNAHATSVGMYQIALPTGTSADIVVTFSGGMTQCRINVYRLVGFTEVIALSDTASAVADTAALGNSFLVPTNGVAIAVAVSYSEAGAITGTTWTGLTEDSDVAPEGNGRASVASAGAGNILVASAGHAGGGASQTTIIIVIAFGIEGVTHDATNGRLQLGQTSGTDEGSGWAHAEQAITINSGNIAKEHVLTFEIAGPGGGLVNFRVGTSTGAADVLSDVPLGVGRHAIGFTPGATTFYIGFRQRNDPIRDMYVDNVAFIDNAPMEIVSPYTSSQLADLRIFQAADVMYLLHPDEVPRRLERRGHKSWSLVEVFFIDGPWLAPNPNISVPELQKLSNPFFENGLGGWTDASSGDGHIFHTSNGAELDDGTSGGSGVAKLRTSFSAQFGGGTYHVMHVLVANQAVTLNIGNSAGATELVSALSLKPGWNHVEFTIVNSTTHIEFTISGHSGERSAISACLVYPPAAGLIKPSSTIGQITLQAIGFAPFASTDVGRLIRLIWPGAEPGYCVVTGYTDPYFVSVFVLRKLPSTAATEHWQFGAFGGDQGYPDVLGFFDGRLALGSTASRPQSLTLSQSSDFGNMQPDSFVEGLTTVEDDDAIDVTLSSKRIDPILWFGELANFVVGTAGAQWAISSIGGVITPADIFAKVNSAIPCGTLDALQVSQAIIFTDKSRRELYEMAFSEEQSGYIPELLTILADHIFKSPAKQLAYQRRPNSTLWCPREDGRIATMAYNRQHQILGWSQLILGGSFGEGDAVVESVAIIPGAIATGSQVYDSDERDEVWMVVKRTINGGTKRYIEVIEGEFEGPLREDYDTEGEWWTAMRTAQKDAFYVDSGITYSGSATSSITGLSHLEGETVKVWADGKRHPDRTVSSGAITLTGDASKVQVGLAYKHRYMSLKLPVGAQAGTAVNKVKAIIGCGVVVLDTGEFKIASVDHDDQQGRVIHDLYTIEFRMASMRDPTEAVPLYTGEKSASLGSNFSSDPRLYIESDAPVPFTLLGLAPEMDGTDERLEG